MSRPAPAPGRAPRSAPPVSVAAVTLATLLLALGVVLVADAAGGLGSGPADLAARLVEALDGLEATVASTAVGVALALVGLALIVEVVRPGARTHVPLLADAGTVSGPADADLWLTPRAVATLAAEQAELHPGVLDAEATAAGRRRVVVTVVPRDVDPGIGLADDVRAAVAEALAEAGLPRPAVTVRVRNEGVR